MKVSTFFAAVFALMIIAGQASAEDSKFSLGLYVVTDDMTKSTKFYEQLFEAKPYVDNGSFVAFSISGNLFSLYSKEAFEHTLTRGNGVVPYIRVSDISLEFERVKALGAKMIHTEVLDEGPIRLFMFEDPGGNPVEFYSLVAQ
jgi:predicted enzyme related to lactoylglutathione lyase